MKQRINELMELMGGQDRNSARALPFASYGDYDNSCAVERSNHRWLEERLSGAAGVTFETWSYGGRSIEVDVEALDDKAAAVVLEYLEAVERYPSIDDELLGEVEREMYLEAMGLSLVDEVPYLAGADLDERETAYLVHEAVETAEDLNCMGEDAMRVEAGGSVYINWDLLRRHLDDAAPFGWFKNAEDSRDLITAHGNMAAAMATEY